MYGIRSVAIHFHPAGSKPALNASRVAVRYASPSPTSPSRRKMVCVLLLLANCWIPYLFVIIFPHVGILCYRQINWLKKIVIRNSSRCYRLVGKCKASGMLLKKSFNSRTSTRLLVLWLEWHCWLRKWITTQNGLMFTTKYK